jgi:hypothetical protein
MLEHLIGKKFPIKDIDGNILDYKKIIEVKAIESVAGYSLTLEGEFLPAFISYSDVKKFLTK